MITLNQNITVDIKINGGYFTNASTVVIPGLTVNSIDEVDDDYLVVNITTGSVDGFFNVEVTNESGTTVFSNGIEVKLSTWVDLRLGGDSLIDGTDVRYRTGMVMARDTQGMFFTGSNPWSSWAKFEKYSFLRSENKTIQWIFSQPTANMMIGIGSTATNETSTAQYAQAEIEAYFNSATNLWGLYGNNGTIGSAGNQNVNTAIGAGTYKIKFTNSGSQGGVFTLYQLPSANPGDWDNENNVLQSFTINFAPDEANLMPFIIPRSADAQRFIALKVE